MDRHVSSGALHHAIMTSLTEQGHAPSCDDLAAHFDVERSIVVSALQALQHEHGVVLHPHVPEVWIAHPFATTPTPFTVRRGSDRWWGNCAWCSLGVAVLVARPGEPVSVATTLGGEDEQVTLRIVDGVLEDDAYVVHFPVPMTRAWDNVVYTCSVMQLFRDAAHVDEWCERHRIPRGDIRPVATVLAFANDWYGRHLEPDWRKWSTDEAARIFERHGLTGPVWALAGSSERF